MSQTIGSTYDLISCTTSEGRASFEGITGRMREGSKESEGMCKDAPHVVENISSQKGCGAEGDYQKVASESNVAQGTI